MVHGEEEKQTGVRVGLQGEGRRSKQREPTCSRTHRTWPPTDQFIFHVVKSVDLNVNPTRLLNSQKNTKNMSHLCHTI